MVTISTCCPSVTFISSSQVKEIKVKVDMNYVWVGRPKFPRIGAIVFLFCCGLLQGEHRNSLKSSLLSR